MSLSANSIKWSNTLKQFVGRVKINYSWYIALFVVNVFIKKLFKIECKYLSFLNIFFSRFCLVEKRGVTPHCLYRDSLTLIIQFY